MKAFLCHPLRRRMFDSFFQVCYRHTISYLRYLKYRGYRLPLDERADKDPLPDLAIDALGTFLQSKKGKPYFIIFDYFKRHKIIISPEADKEQLLDELLILLRGHISQEVFNIKFEHFPQSENLKRRFKDILHESAYCKRKGSGGNDIVSLKSAHDNLRPDKPLIPQDQLVQLVHRTALITTRRSNWCLQIMKELEFMTDYQNCVRLSDLLSAVVRVNAEIVEIEGTLPGHIPGPDEMTIRVEIEKAIKTAVELTRTGTISKFLSKKRLTQDECERLISACGSYLEDLGTNGNKDKLPAYFRESMPTDTHDCYLKEYKHVFETIVDSAVEYLREEIRNNPIIRGLSDYFNNES